MWSTSGFLPAGRIRCFFWKSPHPDTCQSLYRAMEWDTSDPTLQVRNGWKSSFSWYRLQLHGYWVLKQYIGEKILYYTFLNDIIALHQTLK